jgi:hypothetical protein
MNHSAGYVYFGKGIEKMFVNNKNLDQKKNKKSKSTELNTAVCLLEEDHWHFSSSKMVESSEKGIRA